MAVGSTMKFHKFEKVRVIETSDSGVVMTCNESDFGETYWIRWDDDGDTTLMHGDNLEKANVDFQPEKP